MTLNFIGYQLACMDIRICEGFHSQNNRILLIITKLPVFGYKYNTHVINKVFFTMVKTIVTREYDV
jgi:hypothetical protein